jgi:hypothetical protein
MKELTNIYKEAGQQFVDDLFKDYLLVTEKLSGSSFSFERHGSELKFFKGSNKQPINLVDRTLMMYYEPAIQYILSQTVDNLEDLPEYWRFCFQYFVNNQPGAIEYDNMPKNGLILTHIQIRNAKGKIAKVIEDPRVLRDWASAFQVTPLIPIFSGYLKEEQKRKIREFLSTPKEDHLEIFGTSSFAKYLITCLNPTITQTTLQDDLNKPIDSIIFKFFKQGTNQIFAAKMIDPYTEALMKEKEPIDLRRAPADINEILLLDILAFIEERGLRGGELLTSIPSERYLELMSNLFNDYIAKRGVDLQKLDIEKAEFAKGPEFNMNLDLIKNSRTKEILQKSPKLQNLYKIMVGSLRKKRNLNRIGAVMTASVIEDFNKMVSKISDTINKETSNEFKTFGDYLNNKVTEEIDHKDLEELVVEEKVLNYNKFIDLAKVTIKDKVLVVEKVTQSNTQQFLRDLYIDSYNKDGTVQTSSFGLDLRGDFGFPDGPESTQAIKQFLVSHMKSNGKTPSLHNFIVSEPYKGVSGKFKDYDITYPGDHFEFIQNSDKAKDTLQYWKNKGKLTILNKYTVPKSGEVSQVIFTKAMLGPKYFGITSMDFPNGMQLYRAMKQSIKEQGFEQKWKDLLLELMKIVLTGQKGKGYTSINDLIDAGNTTITYDVSPIFKDNKYEDFEKDGVSWKAVQDNFGEILGGFMLFDIIADYEDVNFPDSANHPLADFMWGDYQISSKGAKGASPGVKDAFAVIQKKVAKSIITNLENVGSNSEQDFYDTVILPFNQGVKEGNYTFTTIRNIANAHIGDLPIWSYIINEIGNSDVTEKGIATWMKGLSDAEGIKMLKNIESKSRKFRGGAEKYWKEYKTKGSKKAVSIQISPVMYPVTAAIEEMLNNKYGPNSSKEAFTTLMRQALQVQQIHLWVKLKKDTLDFKFAPFNANKFKFDAKGNMGNYKNKALSMSMIH